MTLGESRLAGSLNRLSEITGRLASWLTVFMVLVTVLVVLMRYVFDAGLIWMQESVIWMHAFVFMAGAAYTLRRDAHVRVDVFYRDWSRRRRALVDGLGVVFFLWPFCGFLAWSGWDYVGASWRIAEASREAGGLPYPWLPLLKSMLLLMPVTVALQGLAIVLQSWLVLRRGED